MGYAIALGYCHGAGVRPSAKPVYLETVKGGWGLD